MRREDLLDLNDVLQHPGRKVAVDISTELPDEADIDLVAPLEGFLEAVSTGNILLITGQFKTRVVVECARCTAPLEQDLDFEVDEQFAVEGIPSSLSQHDFAKVAADEPYALFEENNLIVEALLRQALLLAIPIQPLCGFGWDGPCPVAAQRGGGKATLSAGRPEMSKLSEFLKPEENGS